MADTLVVNEIYLSLQGESTFAGLPCVFIRLTACNLRCSYCDTAYAFHEGKKMTLDEIRLEIRHRAEPYRFGTGGTAKTLRSENGMHPSNSSTRLPLVELTGGEPLLQKASLNLMKRLCEEGYTVLLETSGALDVAEVDPRVRKIMDLKCPSSGEVTRNRWENLQHLRGTDEIKFVVGTEEDYEWTKDVIATRELVNLCTVLVSWVSPLAPGQQHSSLKRVPPEQTPISRRDLAERIIRDRLPVRFQLQMHKFIWPADERGV